MTYNEILKKYFGYSSFRKGQENIVKKMIAGENVSIIMPTGGGKSICYQVPSIAREGVGVIISPLIALMEDQVVSLQKNGIKAYYINSTLSHQEKKEVFNKVNNNEVDLLYVSPELLLTTRFYNWLKTIKIALFAIDEAHCVSQWGHDFRPEYTKISVIVEDFPDIPRMALTATANESTRREILTVLKIDESNQFISGFDRPNIRYYIQQKNKATEFDQLTNYIKSNHLGETGVVYCISRRRTEEVAKHLKKKGLNAIYYHAKLDVDEKKEILNRFTNEDDIIVVATIAFGMGIDKPNVRFVCHMDLPASVESYYQETGRAGRDGKSAIAWMLYGIDDVIKRRNLIHDSPTKADFYKNLEENNLDAMFTLCEVPKCRRQILLNYFGEKREEPCGNCDNCLEPPKVIDGTIYAQKVLSTIARTKQKFGSAHLIDILIGNKTKKVLNYAHEELSVFGVGDELQRNQWQIVMRQMIVQGYIQIEPHYNALWLTEKSKEVLKGDEKISLSSHVGRQRVIYRSEMKDFEELLSFEDKLLLANLRKLRFKIAKRNRIPPYKVFNDETLKELLIKKPKTLNAFERINGIGYMKAREIGQDFVEKIAS